MKRIATAGLLVLGLLQMFGDLFGLAAVRGLAAASAASPAPKVFSVANGLETYSTRFFIEWEDERAGSQSLEVTPETYSRLRGPYNRRNAYGAVVAYGPILATNPRTAPMFEGVARHALCGEAPLLVELGIDPRSVRSGVRVRLEPLPGTDIGDLPSVLEVPCRS